MNTTLCIFSENKDSKGGYLSCVTTGEFYSILNTIWPHYARFLNGLKLEISLSRFAIKSVIFYHASHNNMS